MKQVVVTLKSNYIPLGRPGEYNVDEILFDLAPWVNAHGEGKPFLFYQRPGECAGYPIELKYDKDSRMASWIIQLADNAIPGTGAAQLVYVLENGVRKSKEYIVTVNTSIDERTEVPSGNPPWIDKVIIAGQNAVDAVVHPPIIGEDGYWRVWDFNKSSYIKTDVYAVGPKGDKGETGDVHFATFKVSNGHLIMKNDPNVDHVKFRRKGSRLVYSLVD